MEQGHTKPDTNHRIEFLDSARGLAAMSVMIFHVILMFNWKVMTLPPKIFILLKVIFNGSDAVSFFFVLSGFVLTASIVKLQDNFDYPNYIVRRVFRIYPLYAASVITAFIISGGNKTFVFLQEMNIVSTVHQFVGPGWTMGAEIFISLLMPVFVLTLRHRNMSYVVLLISLFSYNYLSPFAFHFILGMLIYDLYRSRRQVLWLDQARYMFVVLPVLMIFYSSRHIAELSPRFTHLILMAEDFMGIGHGNFFFDLSGIASAAFIIIILQSQRIQAVLSHAILAFIGRISFSIYLIHWLVMNNIPVKKIAQIYPPGALYLVMLIAAVSLITIFISYFTYRFIELPFINLAKKLDLRKWIS